MLRYSPGAAFHKKPISGLAWRVYLKTRAPAIRSIQPEQSFQQLHNQAFDFSYKLDGSVYASVHPVEVQVQCHSPSAGNNVVLAPEMHVQRGGIYKT
jgi:hypothetical protein